MSRKFGEITGKPATKEMDPHSCLQSLQPNPEDWGQIMPSETDVAPWCYKWIGLGWVMGM